MRLFFLSHSVTSSAPSPKLPCLERLLPLVPGLKDMQLEALMAVREGSSRLAAMPLWLRRGMEEDGSMQRESRDAAVPTIEIAKSGDVLCCVERRMGGVGIDQG